MVHPSIVAVEPMAIAINITERPFSFDIIH